MRVVSSMWDPGRIFVLITCAAAVCRGQRSIKNSLLAERKDWLDPSNRFDDARPFDEIHAEEQQLQQVEPNGEKSESTAPGHALIVPGNEKHEKPLGVCERSLSRCEAQLLRYQMTADATNNGALTADMVYLRKWVKSIMVRLEGGYLNQKDTPGRLELSFSTEDIEEFRTLLNKLDAKSASRISSKMNDLVANAEVSFDYQEKPSKFQLFWLSVSDLLSEVNLLSVIRVTILLLTVLFAVIIFTSRSRVFTFGYGLFFLFWLSYFWYWQNLLRRSEADLYLMNQKNPCGDTRPWYNPARYMGSDSKECQEYLRRQFTPAHMEYSPMEVLLHMVSEYSSKAISMGVANLLSGLGLAIREFADQQSWFSVVPAFALLFGVLVVLAFKASGMAVSLFGFRVEASGGRTPEHFEPIGTPRGQYCHDRSEQFILDESRCVVPAIPRYLEDSHTMAFSQSRPQEYRLSAVAPTAIPSSSDGSGLTGMPPPSSSTVLRRVHPDRPLTARPAGQHEQFRKRPFTMTRGGGDSNPGRGNDDDEQEYDTAPENNDL